MTMTMRLTATVMDFDGRYFRVFSANAPGYLQWLNLLPSQMKGAAVGDQVTLQYHSTARYGLWSVSAINPK